MDLLETCPTCRRGATLLGEVADHPTGALELLVYRCDGPDPHRIHQRADGTVHVEPLTDRRWP